MKNPVRQSYISWQNLVLLSHFDLDLKIETPNQSKAKCGLRLVRKVILLYSYHTETNFLFVIITPFTLDKEPPKSISQKGV